MLTGRSFDLTEPSPYGPFIDRFLHFLVSPDLPPLPEAFSLPGTAGAVPRQMTQIALFAHVDGFFKTLLAHHPLILLRDDWERHGRVKMGEPASAPC